MVVMAAALVNGWTLQICQVNMHAPNINHVDLHNKATSGYRCLVSVCGTIQLAYVSHNNIIITETTSLTNCEANLTTSAANMPVHTSVRSHSQLFPSDIDQVNDSQQLQLRLVQSDHRGGFCDCWTVSNLSISFEASDIDIPVM